MKILGIDPGLETTGFGLLDFKKGDYSLLDFGVILTKSKEDLGQRLLQIQEDINEILDEFNPNVVAIEHLFFGTNVTNGILVAHARGVLITEITKRGIDIYEFSPNEVKSIICGNGLASKTQIQKMVQQELDLPKPPKPDDAADALALALCLSFRL